ncbi:MAG: hypothetical protein ACOH2T_19250 [Pseudomonas sp.]
MNKSLLLVLILAGCDGTAIEQAPKPGDIIQVPGFEWRVVDQHDMEATYIAYDMPFKEGDTLFGFQGWTIDGIRRPVVYTLAPRYVDDQPTCTLGHEVLHIILGKYHTP